MKNSLFLLPKGSFTWNIDWKIRYKAHLLASSKRQVDPLPVYANYIGPSVMTDAICEGFPICDDRITEYDRCVIKIIGIHCVTNSICVEFMYRTWWGVSLNLLFLWMNTSVYGKWCLSILISFSFSIIIRAPPSKMREPYSNHFVCPSVRLSVRPSVRLSVCLSVRLSTLRCNAITRKVFDLDTSYFIHRWRIKKGRHL